MEKENKVFIAIILGAFIIGGFMYLAIVKNPTLATKLLFSPANNNNAGSDIKPLSTQTVECQASENTTVTKVIDGDTVVVEGGYHVRLLGIDADEKGYPCYEAAKTKLEELVLNKKVFLEKDITDVDQYARCLRTIFVGSENIDVELVREGLAVARFYEPDVKYKSKIQVAETQAIENKIGCKWSNIK